MKSNTKKVLAAVAAASMLIGAQGAYASDYLTDGGVTDSITSPRYAYFYDYYCEIKLSSSGVLTCHGEADVYYPNTASVKVELQKNGSTIKSWNDSGSSTALVSETYSATRGNTYRLRVTYYAYDSNGNEVEKIIGYSNEVSY